ncbi:MAG: hypothetical protein ACYSSN_08680 [Planctomycetota bacterium]|jgi:hypothetical protein
MEDSRKEYAIRSGRLTAATKSQNGFIRFRRDFFTRFKKSLREEMIRTSSPVELAELLPKSSKVKCRS